MNTHIESSMMLFAANSNIGLAKAVAVHLHVPLGKASIGSFSDGEVSVEIEENVRGRNIFVLQSVCQPTNDNLIELLVLIDALRRASAASITVVIPYLGYSRQDRRPRSARVAITAKVVANLIASVGTDHVLTLDLHADQIQGFFDGPVDHLTAMPVLIDWLSDLDDDDMVIVSPDAGRMKVAERYTNLLNADLAYVHKRRSAEEKNTVEAKEIIGHVEGRTCVLIDDMIDTGGTICAAAELLHEYKAKRIIIATTHGVFSGPAIDRLKNAPVETVLVTDTLPLDSEKQADKIHVQEAADAAERVVSVLGKTLKKTKEVKAKDDLMFEQGELSELRNRLKTIVRNMP